MNTSTRPRLNVRHWLPAQSLQRRLAVRLGALFLLASVLLLGVFVYLSYNLADSLSRRDLFELADELAEEMKEDGGLDDVEELVSLGWLSADTRYAVFDRERTLLVASDPAFVAMVLQRNILGNGTDLFRLDGFGTPARNYLGLVTTEPSEAGRLSIVAAEPEQTEQALLNARVWDVVLRAAWIVPVLIFCTLLVGVLAIRGGLQPLRRTAEEAAAIKPAALGSRLGTEALPAEVYPLVAAFNGALDRLEEGFEVQRRFTANAAHELRTPLAIITSAVDALEPGPTRQALAQDVARMNRLVEQLLHTARLDGQPSAPPCTFDLRQAVHHVLEYMVPVAIAQGQSVALEEPDAPVRVQGDPHAAEDALRNLLDNALSHGRSQDAIVVRVSPTGGVSVCDRGPGLAAGEQAKVFDRFWRGAQAGGIGAGLGLAIVQEIMKRHHGTVHVEDNPGGGVCFHLQFVLTP